MYFTKSMSDLKKKISRLVTIYRICRKKILICVHQIIVDIFGVIFVFNEGQTVFWDLAFIQQIFITIYLSGLKLPKNVCNKVNQRHWSENLICVCIFTLTQFSLKYMFKKIYGTYLNLKSSFSQHNMYKKQFPPEKFHLSSCFS